MKSFLKLAIIALLMAICNTTLQAGATIVVLGSSTAAEGSGWVTKYRNYLQAEDPSHQIVNLAKGGYNTYKAMPDDFVLPEGRENHTPDTDRNITKALTYNPDVIILSFPSNDYSAGISTAEQISNYHTILDIAEQHNIKVFIATPQPTNFNANWISGLMRYMDDLKAEFEDDGIILDFWTTLANENNNLKEGYYKEDGQHLTDAGQTALFEVVRDANLLAYLGYDYQYVEPVRLRRAVYVNFGSDDAPSPWNNTLTGKVKNLLDTEGNKTNISIDGISEATADENAGTTETNTPLDMPESVSQSALYGNNPDGSVFLIKKLSNLTDYNVTLFSSVDANENSVTKFSFTSTYIECAEIDATQNATDVVKLEHLSPDANGNLTVKITASEGNVSGNYYLNAMMIEPVEKRMVALDDFGTINISFGANGIP
ncbi:MAG: SGNH/GDSL hydrolase family protein [Candidatus Symbiothrix sp.]|jgi:hypothetical protein|nr:SGNH/GDSL hydrolase family protein [Candidatus Symbiothrix sp.]